jgi:hypothetical protein
MTLSALPSGVILGNGPVAVTQTAQCTELQLDRPLGRLRRVEAGVERPDATPIVGAAFCITRPPIGTAMRCQRRKWRD